MIGKICGWAAVVATVFVAARHSTDLAPWSLDDVPFATDSIRVRETRAVAAPHPPPQIAPRVIATAKPDLVREQALRAAMAAQPIGCHPPHEPGAFASLSQH